MLGDPSAVPRLIAWLDDGWAGGPAAEALGRIGDPAAVGPLAELLARGDRSARSGARDALVELGHPDAVEALRRADRGAFRRRRLREAERAVARRQRQAAGELPARLHPWPRWLVVSTAKELGIAVLAALVPVAVLGADRRVFTVAAVAAAALLVVLAIPDRRERHRRWARARWTAEKEPRGGPPAPLWTTLTEVLPSRPRRVLFHLAVSLVAEWATGAEGYGAGLVAGLRIAIALDRLLLARLVARWQRASGQRLLTSRGRFFLREPV